MFRSNPLVLSSAVLAVSLAACAAEDLDLDEDEVGSTESAISHRDCPDGVPVELAPAADQDLSFVLNATGVQKYTCAATATGFAWTFVAPEADLFKHGCQVGTHYAGPTWEYKDESTVVAARVAGASPDVTAIPWLLLTAVSHGPDHGKMTPVTSIQRLSTTGGNAPATGCDADHVGASADVPYAADYFFYRTRTKHPERNVRCGG
ncbi:MAG TPA: DUF3455 domain-containing protein [Kofleriaceae bacterium]|nr:DUF3455 domain-containing protein [Kofleriaceae bacterium]